MKNTIQEIISRSLLCEPSQLETPGRILITDCHWTKNFSDCAQLFEIGQRYVFAISFKWAPLFQPILEKIRLGSGLNPITIFKLLRDRKTFHDLKIEQLQDVFFNTNWMYKEQDKPLGWWQSYPIEYSNWISWEEFQKYHNRAGNIYQLGIDARDLESPSDLIERLANIDSSDTIHLVSNSTLNFDVRAFDKHQITIVYRQRITWKS